MQFKSYFTLYKHTLAIDRYTGIINNHLLPTSVLLHIGMGTKQYTNDAWPYRQRVDSRPIAIGWPVRFNLTTFIQHATLM